MSSRALPVGSWSWVVLGCGGVVGRAAEVVVWRARGEGPRGRPAWGSRSGVDGLEDMAVGWRARFARRKWKKAGENWLDELSAGRLYS